MDSLIAAAARALAEGRLLEALQAVALREDPSALALRGIALAQLGEHARSRALLRCAARAFGAGEPLARARCVVAEAEVALAMRDLAFPARTLADAVIALEARGDHANTIQARLIAARRLMLLGRLAEAETALQSLRGRPLAPSLAAVAVQAEAELALRSIRSGGARAALEAALAAARRAGIPALLAEVEHARAALDLPVACHRSAGAERALRMDEVEGLLASGALILDACRRGLRAGAAWLPLARRPVLFALARALAAAWPGDVAREDLIAAVFRTRRPDDTHRARLRVEIGRLRALAAGLTRIEATARGYALRPRGRADVVTLAPPVDGDAAALLALLADGVAWSTSALALALGTSQRTVQRALIALLSAGRVRAVGRARARRWLAPPLVGFTTILLLPDALPPA